jgi:hypothetical protein
MPSRVTENSDPRKTFSGNRVNCERHCDSRHLRSGSPVAARKRPEYTASGDLILRRISTNGCTLDRRSLPTRLMPAWPVSRSHNVYIEPGSYEIYKQTNEFLEGTILFKELQLTLPGQNTDGSRTEPSGWGYFPGTVQWRRCDRQGFQALCRYQWVGVLQFQSS